MTGQNVEKAAETVAITLQVDANVYEAFSRKARQANLDIETFLTNTLTIVLGCRIFDDKFPSSQATPE